MYQALVIILLITISSCSSVKFTGADLSKKNDTFSNETAYRIKYADKSEILNDSLKLCYEANFDKALELLAQQYSTRSNSSSYWNDYGVCHFLKGDLTKAEFYFQLSKNKDNNQQANINLGIILLKNRKFPEALNIFKQEYKRNRSNLALFHMGQIYLQFHLYDKSYDIFSKLNQVNGQDQDVKIGLLSSLVLKGSVDQARVYIKQTENLAQSRNDYQLMHSLFYFKIGEIDKAKEILKDKGLVLALNLKKAMQKLEKEIQNELIKKEQLERKLASK